MDGHNLPPGSSCRRTTCKAKKAALLRAGGRGEPRCLKHQGHVNIQSMLTFPLRCQARSEAGAARILLSITHESSRGLQLPQIHGGDEGATALHQVQVVGQGPAQGQRSSRWMGTICLLEAAVGAPPSLAGSGQAGAKVRVPLRRGVCVYPANGHTPAVKNANVAAKV